MFEAFFKMILNKEVVKFPQAPVGVVKRLTSSLTDRQIMTDRLKCSKLFYWVLVPAKNTETISNNSGCNCDWMSPGIMRGDFTLTSLSGDMSLVELVTVSHQADKMAELGGIITLSRGPTHPARSREAPTAGQAGDLNAKESETLSNSILKLHLGALIGRSELRSRAGTAEPEQGCQYWFSIMDRELLPARRCSTRPGGHDKWRNSLISKPRLVQVDSEAQNTREVAILLIAVSRTILCKWSGKQNPTSANISRDNTKTSRRKETNNKLAALVRAPAYGGHK